MIRRREFLAVSAAVAYPTPESTPIARDVFVYGSTPGGIAAAVEVAQRGLKVVLACPQKLVRVASRLVFQWDLNLPQSLSP